MGYLKLLHSFLAHEWPTHSWGLETSLRSQGYDPSYLLLEPGSQNLLVSLASTEAWPVRKLGSKWEPHTNMTAPCVYVCRTPQTSNKQMPNKQQVVKQRQVLMTKSMLNSHMK